MAERKYLIVVDMQNDFVDGALGTKEAQAIVPAVVNRLRECRKTGYRVLATMDTHGTDYLQTSEGRNLPVPHCIRGTQGWEINPRVKEALGDSVLLEKPTFGSVLLPEIIRQETGEKDSLSIELLGLCTDICVVSNALLLKANFPEAAISLCEACCAGVTPEKHLAALDTMRSCQIAVF